jgi:hypothetical protein
VKPNDGLHFDPIKHEPKSSAIAHLINRSKALSVWMSQNIDGMAIPADQRSRLAAGCLHLMLEHHDGIILLIDHGAYGSAFALLRLAFESYVRGVWLSQCATEEELEAFKKEKLGKSFGSLIKELEQRPGFSSGVLSIAKQQSWGFLNSLTHSGFAQVVRRHSAVALEAN